MLNNRPRPNLNSLTANEALFGAPDPNPLQPPAEVIANLLQLNRWAWQGTGAGSGQMGVRS